MRGGYTYRHWTWQDIDMYVHKVQYRCEEYIKIKASLFHRRLKNVYETKHFVIKTKDLYKWKQI